LNFLDHQLAIRPTAVDLWLEKANLWEQMGSLSSALMVYEGLQSERQLPAQLAQEVEQRVAQLRARPRDVLH